MPTRRSRASGADVVMVGRAAQGRPWFPGQIARYLETGRREQAPPLATQFSLIVALYDEMLAHHGLRIGLKHARKHLGWALDAAALNRRRRPRHAQGLAQHRADQRNPRGRTRAVGASLRRLCLQGRRMSDSALRSADLPLGAADAVLNALPLPVIIIESNGRIADANVAAESFFEASVLLLRRQMLRDLVPFGSPLLALVEQVRNRGAAVNEYKVDLSTPRNPGDRLVDLHVAPLPERPNHVVVMLQERTIADKMDRQLTHRGAARSVSALAAMLAHEIKNPLSGIRGAAQLLEQSAGDDDRTLTRLICDEADRIVKLVDRMEVFSDERPVEREPVNIHAVLDHVKRLAQSGFARRIKICRDLRSVAAAGVRQPRPAHPGVPQPGEERRRVDRRSRNRRRNPAHHGVPARRSAEAAGIKDARIAAARILRQGQRAGRAPKT